MDLGQKIRQARTEAGLTQKDVEDWLGIPLRTLQDWERGRRAPSEWIVALVTEKMYREGTQWKAGRARR